MSFPKTRQI